MATPKQNYARQFQAYAQGIEPDIPASVRTYSIFNPDTGTWQRMTNGFRSPIPAQGQAVVPVQVPAQPAVDPVVQALALARQTQGRDWSMPLPQTPAQIPSGGSRRRSPASGGGTVVVPADRAQSVPQTASKRGFDIAPFVYEGKPAKDVKISATPNQSAQAETVVQLPLSDTSSAPSSLYMGTGKLQDGTVVYDSSFNDYTPTTVLSMSPDSRRYDRIVDYDNDDAILRATDIPLENIEATSATKPDKPKNKFRYGRPVGFLGHIPKGTDISKANYVDPSEGTISYTDEMTNLGKAINQDPEVRQYVAPVWGTAVSVGVPLPKLLSLGAGFLKGTKIATNLNAGFKASTDATAKVFRPLINKVYNSRSAQQAIIRNDPWKIIREYIGTHPSAGTTPGTNIAEGLRTGANTPSVAPSIWANAHNIR